VGLRHVQDMCAATCLVSAKEAERMGPGLLARRTAWFRHASGAALNVALERARAGLPVALVSAASAYDVGGGFEVGGRHALEEALCMQTTLFQSLLIASTQARLQGVVPPASCRPCRQADGSPWRCHVPEDGAVLTPCVEVFRGGTEEGYPFLPSAVRLGAIVSVAMPNLNLRVTGCPVDAPTDRREYLALLTQKLTAALGAAARAGALALVVPDLGCGALGNDPRAVGRALGSALQRHFPRAFAELHLVGQSAFAAAAEAAGRAY